MKVLDVIQGCEILVHDDGHLSYVAKATIDCDGSGGNPDNDPYFQPDTSLHRNGQALNAYRENFIVVPPSIINGVRPIVLGCKAAVLYRETGKMIDAVVGDIGPRRKLGELSVAAARALGMSGNPNTGGEDDFRQVVYLLWPGIAAVVDGVQYNLQAS